LKNERNQISHKRSSKDAKSDTGSAEGSHPRLYNTHIYTQAHTQHSDSHTNTCRSLFASACVAEVHTTLRLSRLSHASSPSDSECMESAEGEVLCREGQQRARVFRRIPFGAAAKRLRLLPLTLRPPPRGLHSGGMTRGSRCRGTI
jgi:hypothetical protein